MWMSVYMNMGESLDSVCGVCALMEGHNVNKSFNLRCKCM